MDDAPEKVVRVTSAHGAVSVPVEDTGSAPGDRKSIEHIVEPFAAAEFPNGGVGRKLARAAVDDVVLVRSIDFFHSLASGIRSDRRHSTSVSAAAFRFRLPVVVAAAVIVEAASGVAKAIASVERKSGVGACTAVSLLARQRCHGCRGRVLVGRKRLL